MNNAMTDAEAEALEAEALDTALPYIYISLL